MKERREWSPNVWRLRWRAAGRIVLKHPAADSGPRGARFRPRLGSDQSPRRN
jgi:hypothetical protein